MAWGYMIDFIFQCKAKQRGGDFLMMYKLKTNVSVISVANRHNHHNCSYQQCSRLSHSPTMPSPEAEMCCV